MHYPMSATLINISSKQAWWFATFLVFYEFLTYITNDMIMPGMLVVVKEFHASETAIPDSLTAYLLGGASLQIFLGPWSDAIGRRPVMLTGCLLFFCFTLLLAFAPSMSSFLLGRFFQGMGLCFIIIGYAVIQELFAEMDAVRLIALMANASTLAPLIGPLVGTVFLSHYSWQSMYLWIAGLTLMATLGLWITMPETVGVEKIDGSKTPRHSLKPSLIFERYQLLLQHGSWVKGVLSLGLLCTPCLAWIGLAPVILVQQAGLSMMMYAWWQVPFFLAIIAGNITLSRLTQSCPNLSSLIQYGSLYAISGLILMAIGPMIFHQHYLSLMPGLCCYGLGLGIVSSPLTRHLLFLTPAPKGVTNACINLMNMLIMGLGTYLAKWIYSSHQNVYFGLYVALLGVLSFLFWQSCPRPTQDKE